MLELELSGRLDSESAGRLWREMERSLASVTATRAVVDGSGIEYCDGAGIGLLIDLRRRVRAAGGEVEFRGLREETDSLLRLYDPSAFDEEVRARTPHRSVFEAVGRAGVQLWEDAKMILIFAGALTVALVRALLHPATVRWKDVLLVTERAGVNALPIVTLICFLIGLIMAYQSAIPMRLFGAELYVANLVGISLVRELGPLMTAIVLCGRSGSAFAAEIGTMKVNEEVNALTTMGLEPVRIPLATSHRSRSARSALDRVTKSPVVIAMVTTT